MLESHYAPRVPLEAFESLEGLRRRALELEGECVVLSAEALQVPCREARVLGSGASMAVGLFSALREIDQSHAPRILALLPDASGLGLAVRDRLFRASRSRIAG
jgi:L-threonylcarbamoyladenylate synthase